MNFVFKMMSFALKMMSFVFKMASFVLKMMICAEDSGGGGLSGARMFVAALQWAHNENQRGDGADTQKSTGSAAAAATTAMDTGEKKASRAAVVVERGSATFCETRLQHF